MLTIQQILKNLVLLQLKYNYYGMCTKKITSLIKCASSYYWLTVNASECITDCEQKTIDQFIKENTYLANLTCTEFLPIGGVAEGDPVDITCQFTNFNLNNYIGGSTVSGTWSEVTTLYTSNGGTITDTTLGTVNFLTMPVGSYTFKKVFTNTDTTGTCTKQDAVLLNLIKVPNVGQC